MEELIDMSARVQNEAEITALLIAPNRELAQQFLATLPQTRAFQILADLKSYPPQQTLEIRARQLKPNVVLLDLATRSGGRRGTDPLHRRSDAAGARGRPAYAERFARRFCNRCGPGASEFLYAPFELATQREAIARLRRLVGPEAPAQSEAGHVIALRQLQARLGRLHHRHADRVFAAAAHRQADAAGRLRPDRRHHRLLSEAEPQLFAGGRACSTPSIWTWRCGIR